MESGGQGFHRIDEDRLDGPLADGQLLAAVLQHMQQEALGFAGPRAGGYQGVLGCARLWPVLGLLLVAVGAERQWDGREPVLAAPLLEGHCGGDEGPLHQPLPIGAEAIDQALETRCGEMKRRLQGIAGDLLKFAGDDRGEQVAGPSCSNRLCEIACLPSGLNHSATA